MTLQKGNFVSVEYTGTIKNDGTVFDSTNEEVAKQHDIFDKSRTYGPLTVCLGQNFLIKGLDDKLIGKELNKEYTIEISAEEGFGKKDPKLIQMIPASKFKQHNIKPFPGLQLTIDGTVGVVKTVSGGRVLVDFNHLLAGKDIVYNITPTKLVEKQEQQVECFLHHMGLENLDITTKDGMVTIKLETDLDQRIKDEFSKKIKEVIPSLKGVEFSKQEPKPSQ